ncbi:bifunctional DNA-binding transcriptional regulator/O6-methylguanine-DNA methyltransferase Ada [Granulicella sp. 5B5]|uniref:bifunctional DNA-binding transcriptional regulator/O6-methylguanine-DNA methyltransferase Ada n=1 Tax=Granulicella sp. 5B5 TaxID=1617967 RepID=UPI0015F46893|nr:bifunctional DNA-binding transcriptional regulator/O6-methylguanine-DNA methyltransferase Ada [Granulicella sp. 5B5]
MTTLTGWTNSQEAVESMGAMMTQIPFGNDKQRGSNKDSGKRGSAMPVFAGKAWQQVLARDAAADGQFVYAVKSTGVYCKPSCASRRPERKNVSFFPSPALAEAAGFRACLRCEPALVAPKDDPQAGAVKKAAEFLTAHASERTTLDDLAAASGLGRFALQRGFKRVLGVTPAEFAREQRKERFREKVREPRLRVTDAVYEAGYGSSSRVYENVDATLGMSPTAMKAGGAGETIRYAMAESPLGRVLVGATERGLCAVLFADSDAEAAVELRERFPQAVLRRDDAGLGDEVRAVLSGLHESQTARALPFHVRATAFQQRVWQALMAIPRGETRTYAEIAEAIGSPKAVRAVGTACGANPLAMVIPCHRVVGSDGKLTGYRWGTERKRQLLEMESAS